MLIERQRCVYRCFLHVTIIEFEKFTTDDNIKLWILNEVITIIKVGKKEPHSKLSAVLLSTFMCSPKTTTKFSFWISDLNFLNIWACDIPLERYFPTLVIVNSPKKDFCFFETQFQFSWLILYKNWMLIMQDKNVNHIIHSTIFFWMTE